MTGQQAPPPPAQNRHRAGGGRAPAPASRGSAPRARRPPADVKVTCAASQLVPPIREPRTAPRPRRSARSWRTRWRGSRQLRGRNLESSMSGARSRSGPAKRRRNARRRPGAARRNARAARPGQGSGPDVDPRRRPDAPHARSLRRHALQPGAGAARSEAQRHPLAGRRIACAAPISAPDSTRCARSRPTASARAASGRAPACRSPRRRCSRATSCARPRSGSARRLADRDAHRHRRAPGCATAAASSPKSQHPGAPTPS